MKKRILIFSIDVVLLLGASLCAFFLKYYPEVRIEIFTKFFFLTIMVHVITLQLAGTYQWSFSMANVNEFVTLAGAIIIGGVIGLIVAACFGAGSLWQFFIIETIMALLVISLFRFSLRIWSSLIWGRSESLKKVLIIGAGEAGEAIVKKMKQDPSFGYLPVAFIDDDPRKKGMKIRGIKVVGNSSIIPKVALEKEVEQIIITMPSASGSAIRKVVSYCEKTNAKVKILPGIWEIILGDAYLHQIRDIQPEDLLGRETVKTDVGNLWQFFDMKTVLVTGACGSIGSELITQLRDFSLKSLIALDRNENEMYFLQYQSTGTTTEKERASIIPILADVTDGSRMRDIISQYKPDIIFHAAAYKHVPLMEIFPKEAIRNNIQATQLLAEIAEECNVEYFALISTDKAVRPKNIMGYTKRIAELVIQSKTDHKPRTKFFAVRFGNVLGSNGSIVPILKKQIRNGGPVTVTSKEAKRYFMTIAEAVQLILQATSMAAGGEIFVLDMGEQVSIDALARDMIRFMGLIPGKDIQIEYTGMRPGEKVEEDLFENRNDYKPTQHEKILVSINGGHALNKDLAKDVSHLIKKIENEKHLTIDFVKDSLRSFLQKYNINITD